MDSSHILKPIAIVSYTFSSKLKRFLAAALLADWVLGNAVNVFIQNLNRKGLLGLGGNFESSFMVWGDSVWVNILHILILAFTAGLFGFIFGCLSRRVSLSDKIIFTFLYVFIRFVFLGLFSLIVDNFIPSYSANWNQLVSEGFYSITSSSFNATFVILGHLVMFASAFYFMKTGGKVISDPYYTTDRIKSGTLLEVRWYHFFWLFIPISIYSQIILNLLYQVGHTIITLVRNFKWTTIFGGEDGDKGNALNVAWGSLTFIIIVSMIILYLMEYLRTVVAGETSQHWAVKILIVIVIGLGIPFLILWFTSLAG